jgi:hypothetical protein
LGSDDGRSMNASPASAIVAAKLTAQTTRPLIEVA